MDISNLSREQKKEKILEDHSKKKATTISSTLFPKEKLEDKEILDILDKIIDEIGYITDAPNIMIGSSSHQSKTIVGGTINELTNFVLNSLNQDESIGIYQIGFDKQINKYSIRLFFYADIGRKVRRIRENKIDLILNDKSNI
jgi:hypothetical protein